ncbi:P-loop containing nucleoside triphosphate hydrolase protein [Lipomyces japonicus]|uniref:P-loop containing nucleoside triphosphate hydrolase protein n=1 Tax=Lipomyces japonicus TaxID=56871 RepID=UPI0034CD4F06
MASKRKRNDNEVESNLLEDSLTFESLNLDQRLLQAIARLNFTKPTLVQAKAIPLALEGKDILARAKTGSGKTAAYVIPLIQSIIQAKESRPNEQATKSIILVPSRELADQCVKFINKLIVFCGKLVRAVNIAQNVSDQVQRTLLAESPDIVVGTPSRVLANINSSAISVSQVTNIVIDEADLILSYGYEEDLQSIQKKLPKTLQVSLMSATLTSDVNDLKGLFCRNPAILTLHEGNAGSGEDNTITQYVVKCSEFDKFLLAYVIFKLNLIKGKTLVFVNDIDRCYRLKLFLEQFGIRACVLNSDLPVNSRLHVVEQFNKNIYSLIIATDEADQIIPEEEQLSIKKEEKLDDDDDDVDENENNSNSNNKSKPKKKKRKSRDRDYGVSRGIDFENVSCVLNFDLPKSAKSYIHRIGRTGRAGQAGMALSFVIPKAQWGIHKASSLESAKKDEKVLARIEQGQQKKSGVELKPYAFDMNQVDAFRYRMDDAFRAVTKTAIREARAKELKQEILASEKLKKHFDENPDELEQLRHDRDLHAVRVQHHLKHVPDYLLPEAGRQSIVKDLGFVGIHKSSHNRIRKARMLHKSKSKPKRVDPLKSFKGRKVNKGH